MKFIVLCFLSFASAQLRDFFYNRADLLIHKWDHYFDIYEENFKSIRDKAWDNGSKVVFCEIGVSGGGSLQMWIDYFGSDHIELYAIDIDPRVKIFESMIPGVTIFIGDQGDPLFLESIKQHMPPLDILLDDGGHFMDQQKITFDHLYSHVKENSGVYICEDTHTSYWLE